MPADLDPRNARPTRKNLVKAGFKLPSTHPIGIPAIVTRYVVKAGQAPAEDLARNDGHRPIPCRIVNRSTEDGELSLEIEHDQDFVTRLLAELARTENITEDKEQLLRANWQFVFPGKDANRVAEYDRINLETVIRIPEFEPLFGINPKSIRILLPSDEMPVAERAAYAGSFGMEPDFECLTAAYKLYKSRSKTSWCTGNGVVANRMDDKSREYFQLACGGRTRTDDGAPNPNTCEFRGQWKGGTLHAPRTPCKENYRFRFYVQGVATLWCYEMVSGSRNSYDNLRGTIAEVCERSSMAGRDGQIKGLPMVLSVKADRTFRLAKFTSTPPIWHLDIDKQAMKDASPQTIALVAGKMRKALPSLDIDPDLVEDDLSEFYPESHPPSEVNIPWTSVALADPRVKGAFEYLGIGSHEAECLVLDFHEGHPAGNGDGKVEALIEELRDLYAKKNFSKEPDASEDVAGEEFF
jgi:hypothetical protein